MQTVFYKSDDNKYYLNEDEVCHSDKEEMCNSCNEVNNQYYIFSRSISAIFENIKKEKIICPKCYNFKKNIQREFSLKDNS